MMIALWNMQGSTKQFYHQFWCIIANIGKKKKKKKENCLSVAHCGPLVVKRETAVPGI